MRIPRLYCPDLAAGSPSLPVEEVHHAASVLRARPGEPVVLFDGEGHEARAVFERVGSRRVEVRIEERMSRPFDLPCRLTLAVAMPKQHRQGYLIEKCTELGVAGIWPITTAHSCVMPRGEASAKWFRRGVEAAKQCGRAWVPQVERPQTFAGAWSRRSEFDTVVMLGQHETARSLADWCRTHGNLDAVLAWIGPEGGWTEEELSAAAEANVPLVHLGPLVLRTETAAIAFCAGVGLLSVATTGAPTPQAGQVPRK
ncbi:MAG TPA: RsmE family RNA methyltransferase [Phycisphaerae bacterium]|nr:RsmE family RNA methyltransferase [Phycisphaerae bacterium]HNU47132.1 RsmE family RNA methyltransferase [Phycisphaerae bacterium]